MRLKSNRAVPCGSLDGEPARFKIPQSLAHTSLASSYPPSSTLLFTRILQDVRLVRLVRAPLIGGNVLRLVGTLLTQCPAASKISSACFFLAKGPYSSCRSPCCVELTTYMPKNRCRPYFASYRLCRESLGLWEAQSFARLVVKIGIRSLGHCPMMPHFATNALSLGPRLRRQAPRLRRAVRGFGGLTARRARANYTAELSMHTCDL